MLKNYLIKLLVQFDNIPVNENIKDRAFGPEPSTNHPPPPLLSKYILTLTFALSCKMNILMELNFKIIFSF